MRGRSESGHPADGETDTRRQVIIGIDYDYIISGKFDQALLYFWFVADGREHHGNRSSDNR